MRFTINKKTTIFCLSVSITLLLGVNGVSFSTQSNKPSISSNYISESIELNRSNKGFINNSNQEIFWFIQITDTQYLWYYPEKILSFYKFLNESYREINPLFIINTGDLVDANNGENQDRTEWVRYRKALEDNQMNSSIYIDLIGNHDAITDSTFSYFLNYSVIGRTYNTTLYSFNRTFSFGEYAFIGLNTAKDSYNFFEFAFSGYLDSKELDWYENELRKYNHSDRIFVFGHHPIWHPPFFSVISESSSSGNNFYELNKEYSIFSYLSGHIHLNTVQRSENFFMLTTANFDQNNGTYRIVSLDNNQLSTSIEYVNKWPQGIITYPPRQDFQCNDAIIDETKIRVLAWDPLGLNSVEWCAYDLWYENSITNWVPMQNIIENGPLWESDLDLPEEGRFLIKVKIIGGSGSNIKEFIYNSSSFLVFIPIVIIIIMSIGLLSLTMVIQNHFKITIQKVKAKMKKLFQKEKFSPMR